MRALTLRSTRTRASAGRLTSSVRGLCNLVARFCILLLSLGLNALAQTPRWARLAEQLPNNPSLRVPLIKEILKGHVFTLASWENPNSKTIRFYDFVLDGKPFIPIFSDETHLREESLGSGHEQHGISIDANLLFDMATPEQIFRLNPGSKTPIVFLCSEFKPFINHSRLPKGRFKKIRPSPPNHSMQPTVPLRGPVG